jgi:hypothetical protein
MTDSRWPNLLRFVAELDVLLLVNQPPSISSEISLIVLLGVLGLGGELVRDVRFEDWADIAPSILDAVAVRLALGMPSIGLDLGAY